MACNFLAVIFFNYVFLGHVHGLLLTDPAHVEQRLNQMESQIQGLSQEVNTLKQENAALKAQVSSGIERSVLNTKYKCMCILQIPYLMRGINIRGKSLAAHLAEFEFLLLLFFGKNNPRLRFYIFAI